jgi:hypothetical protein
MELQQRLTAIMEASPRNEYLNSRRDPCIQRIIRLRDIAVYCGVDRQDIYRVRRGERILKPDLQRKLSWFFFNLDRGRLTKELEGDGRWRIIPAKAQVPAAAPDAGPPAIEATVDFATGRLTLK